MSLATDLQGDIAELLDNPDYGRDITLRKATKGSYDPATGQLASLTTTDYATRGLLLRYRDAVIDGTIIKQQDRKCVVKVKGLAATPEVEDRVIVGPDTYTVINFKTIELGGTVVLYTLQVRK